jgi:hypothetical protein
VVCCRYLDRNRLIHDSSLVAKLIRQSVPEYQTAYRKQLCHSVSTEGLTCLCLYSYTNLGLVSCSFENRDHGVLHALGGIPYGIQEEPR